MSILHEEMVFGPAWIEDMQFCHVTDRNEPNVALCGLKFEDEERDGGSDGVLCPSDYDGQAICPDCGNPVCPRCAQLADLEFRL